MYEENDREIKSFFEHFLYDFMMLVRFLENILNEAVKGSLYDIEIYEFQDKVEFHDLRDKVMVVFDLQGISNSGEVNVYIKSKVLSISAIRDCIRYYHEIPLNEEFELDEVTLKNGVLTVILKRKK